MKKTFLILHQDPSEEYEATVYSIQARTSAEAKKLALAEHNDEWESGDLKRTDEEYDPINHMINENFRDNITVIAIISGPSKNIVINQPNH